VGLACSSSTHQDFRSDCATGKESNFSRRKRRFSGTDGFVLGEKPDNIGLSGALLDADRWKQEKVALSVSEEEPSNIGMDVQPFCDKLIPHFHIELVGG
jgi:hypothetical protein